MKRVLVASVLCIILLKADVRELEKKKEPDFSITLNSREGLLAAYHNGLDVTDDYLQSEEYFKERIDEYLGEVAFSQIERIYFCYFVDNYHNMTAEFTYNGKEYCISMFDWEIGGLEKIKLD